MWRRFTMTEDDVWEFVCMYKWVKSMVDFYFVLWLIACLMLLKSVSLQWFKIFNVFLNLFLKWSWSRCVYWAWLKVCGNFDKKKKEKGDC